MSQTNGESSDTSYFFNQSFWIMIFSAVEVLIAQVGMESIEDYRNGNIKLSFP
jgi:hypothetical protein